MPVCPHSGLMFFLVTTVELPISERCDAFALVEQPCHVFRVGKSGCKREVSDWHVGRHEQLLHAFKAQVYDVLVY